MSELSLTRKQHNKIKRAVKALNDVRKELQVDNSDYDINWYLEDCGNLCIMEGESHDDKGETRQDRIISIYDLEYSSGGGW